MTVSNIPSPSPFSPLSAIQGTVAYGDGLANTTTTIKYNFHQFSNTQYWTSEYKADFKAALAAIEAVANIQFVEVFNQQDADIYEVIAPGSVLDPDNPNLLGFHSGPGQNPSIGAFSTDYWDAGSNGNGDPGGYFFTTLLHELGHALGLGHPHDTSLGTTVMNGVTSEFNSFGAGNLNQGIFTVMSYNDGWTDANGLLPLDAKWGGSTGLGALDIAALQAMYGANTSNNGGTNSYNLASYNTSGVGYQAIWDTGGIDTIRHTGSGGAQIDLRPASLDYSVLGGGGVSYVYGVQGGFTIAHGVVIENASGGSGNDTIAGNTAENVLNGNGGHDLIYSFSNGSNNNTVNGGQGNDTIHVANGAGADTVNGNEGNDLAIVNNNAGSFDGGSGIDTIRFISATSSYLFINNGSSYEFLNVLTYVTFTVSNVELFQFLNGAQQYDLAGLTSATLISDIDTTDTVLQHAAHGIYVLNGGSSNIAVTMNGQVIGENSFAGWEAIQTETSGGGYRLLWQHSNGTYSDWTLNSLGQFVSATEFTNVVDVEEFYGADLNNDGVVGHFVSAVESAGSTTLASSTHGMYLIDGSIEVTQNGEFRGPDSFAGWEAIQVEASNGGYRLLWKSADGTYSDWTLDAQGAFVTAVNFTDPIDLIDVETLYDVDLNDDGEVGHFNTTIENNDISLASSTRGVYVINGTIDVTQNGEFRGPDSFAGWEAIQVEDSNGGYRLLWKSADGTYSDWTLDAQGAFVSAVNFTNLVDLIDVEEFYGVDLNDDGEVGHFNTTIESTGSTELASSTRGMYLIDGSIEVTQNGEFRGPDSFAGWEAIQVEDTTDGYRLLWKNVDGTYSDWTLDAQGEFVTAVNFTDPVDVEAFYGVDLDESGFIGPVPPKIAPSISVNQKVALNSVGVDALDWDASADELEFKALPQDTAEYARSTGLPGLDDFDFVSLHASGDVPASPLDAAAEPDDQILPDLLFANMMEEDSFLI
ncbi:matrixin family metalloprotease [Rhodobacteraceae bacterium B1Z28]|uniref:Matrixin family metalloprotease n=1 Tax=Ruegeria haliotis TaxID=2747601 RepID=A0ABX2PKR0_9RHOB|nr:matrixin family metalloprotease [Ruegeria haliotis]NVO54718.1 matrixin family metalloprotease [Ruegeria haliotis]